MVGYGERSAIQAGIGGRADLEGATANMSTEVGDLDAALAASVPAAAGAVRRQRPARPPPPGRRQRPGHRLPGRRPAAAASERLAANQPAHAALNAVAELLDAGAALRQAQQDALAGQPGAAR